MSDEAKRLRGSINQALCLLRAAGATNYERVQAAGLVLSGAIASADCEVRKAAATRRTTLTASVHTAARPNADRLT